MSVSSHKSESTVKTYARKCPEKKKLEMSAKLSEKIAPTKQAKNEPEPPPQLPDMFDLIATEPHDDELLSQFLDATEKEPGRNGTGTR